MRVFGLILVAFGVSACAFDDHRTCLDDTHCENGQRCQFSYCVDPMTQSPDADVDLGSLDMRIPQRDMKTLDQGRLPDMAIPDQAMPDRALPDQGLPDMGSLISRRFEATDDAYVTVMNGAQLVNSQGISLQVRNPPLFKATYIRFDLGADLHQSVRARLRLHIEAPSSAERGVLVQQTPLNWAEGQNELLEWSGEAQLGTTHWISLAGNDDSVEFDLGEIQITARHVAFWISPTPGFGGELVIHSTNALNGTPPQLFITKIP